MNMLYGKGYSESDRKGFAPVIHTNVLMAAQTLAANAPNYGTLSPAAEQARNYLDNVKGQRITTELAKMIEVLWKDQTIRLAFEHRQQFQLFDSAHHFFNQIQNLTKEDYLPTFEDILLIRARTTGVSKNEFTIDGVVFQMFDVGGQRNERKKWISIFDNVTAVVFVAAISEYDQLCFEDEKTNRMEEALVLFDEICNSPYFERTSMILFLNKRDLFATKIQAVPLKKCFPEYPGQNNFEEGTTYVRAKFLEKNTRKEKVIYTHITCATDQNNVRTVFLAVKDIIIRNSLAQAGLMDAYN